MHVKELRTSARLSGITCAEFSFPFHIFYSFPPLLLIHSSIPLLLAVTGHMRTRFVGSLVLGNWLMTKLRHVPSQHNKGQHLSHLSTSLASPSLSPDQQLLCQISADFNWDFKRQRHVRSPPAWSLTPAHWVQSVSALCCAVLQNHPLNLRIISQCWLIPLSTLPSSPSSCLLKSSWQYGD